MSSSAGIAFARRLIFRVYTNQDEIWRDKSRPHAGALLIVEFDDIDAVYSIILLVSKRLRCIAFVSGFRLDWTFFVETFGFYRCRSETCCRRLAENTGLKKVANNRHLGTIPQLCRAISSQLRHVSTIGKNLLSSCTCSTCPDNMVNFGLLTAVWGTPTNFNGFCVLAALLHGI